MCASGKKGRRYQKSDMQESSQGEGNGENARANGMLSSKQESRTMADDEEEEEEVLGAGWFL